MLTFTATGQKLKRTDSIVIVAGTRELYQCVFTFDAAWDGYARVAVFHGAGLARTRALAEDACDIPWECITDVGRLRIGVYGINGDTRMPTLWAEEINVRPGSYDATDEPLPPTQSEYEQIINIMQTQATDATRAEAAQTAAETARDEAAGSATDAAGSATRAAASEGAADTANAAAQESAEAAQGSETAAKTSEVNAGQSATNAAAAKTAAEQARNRAETAKTAAETARATAAERAAAAALSAANAANAAAGVQGVVAAATEHARDAGLAADAAAAYAAAAEGSAEDAAAAKAAAIDKATEADTASRNAIAAEIAAGGHATNAAGSAQSAEESATLARVDYDIDGDRIGFKRGNVAEFEYTPHLTGATGTTAYASAVLGGYTGTEAQFYTDVAKVSEKASQTDFDSHAAQIASSSTLAHVKPVSADNTMILPVGTDADGKLWTSPDILLQIYGVRWDMVNSQCSRCFAAADITTTTTNFGYFGSVNANYDNPFDNIYPWSGRKLCNISLDLYLALTSEDSIVDCVSAWENGIGFNMEHADGVWVYTPEYWYRRWDKDGFRYIAISGVLIDGWNYSPERIRPRWKGVMEDRVIEGATKTILLPKVGQPAASVAMSSMHGYAKNANMTLENIYSFDAEAALYLVEYANMNSQTALGNGVSDLYRQSGYTIQSNTTDSNVIQILASQASTLVIQGATLDIGTTDGGMQIGRFMVVSSTVNSINNMLIDVTLDRATSVTTAHFWSIHGLTNVLDTDIGSKSGYIGTNGRCNAYYRGNTIYSNRYSYILGAYREKDTGHIWIAPNEVSTDEVDALDISKHIDTGLVLPQGDGGASYSGYIKTMGVYDNLVLPPFCTIGGGNSSNPVGDYIYTPSLNIINTVLISGGDADHGSSAGLWYGTWGSSAAGSNWIISAFPLLKTP